MTAIVLLALLLILGFAAVMGWTHDSRDSDYNLGAVLRRPTGRPHR